MFGRNPANNVYAKLANKILPFQLRIESILISAFVLGFLLKEIPEIGPTIVIISLSSLALIYMILAYKSYSDDEKLIHIILNQVIHISFSVSIVGILFNLLKWPGSSPMTILGLSIMCIGIVLNYLFNLKRENKINFLNPNTMRAIVILFVYCIIPLIS